MPDLMDFLDQRAPPPGELPGFAPAALGDPVAVGPPGAGAGVAPAADVAFPQTPDRPPPQALEFPGLPDRLLGPTAFPEMAGQAAQAPFAFPPLPEARFSPAGFPDTPQPLLQATEFPALPERRFSETHFPGVPRAETRQTEFPQLPQAPAHATGDFAAVPARPLAAGSEFPEPPQAFHREASEQGMKMAENQGMSDMLGMLRQMVGSMGDAVTALQGLGRVGGGGGMGGGNARPGSFHNEQFHGMQPVFTWDEKEEGFAAASPSMSWNTSKQGLRRAGGYGAGTNASGNSVDFLEPNKRRPF